MGRPRSMNDMTCQNTCCNYYEKVEGKDIIKRGKNRAGHQQYFCNHCNSWFVETANTPLYHKRLPLKDMKVIIWLLVEKNGIRSIERITGHHRDTISHLIEDFCIYAEMMPQFLQREVQLTQTEINDLWSTIKKVKRKFREKA